MRWGGGWLAGSTAVNDGNWHLLTYTDSVGVKTVYVDGIAETLSQSQFLNTDTGSKIRLGFAPTNVDGEVPTNGLLSGIAIYNTALSSAQVAAMYSAVVGNTPLPAGTDVTIASGATLDVNGMTQQIASLSGPTGSVVTLGAGQLIVSSATSTQFAGTISGNGGSLVKQGAGTLTLAGANSYTGPTSVNGGTLRVNGSISGDVAVNSGGTLQGSGTIGGVVIVASGGTLAPGNSPGVLTVGSLEFERRIANTNRVGRHEPWQSVRRDFLNGCCQPKRFPFGIADQRLFSRAKYFNIIRHSGWESLQRKILQRSIADLRCADGLGSFAVVFRWSR